MGGLYDYLLPADCPCEGLAPEHRVCVPFKAGEGGVTGSGKTEVYLRIVEAPASVF